MARRDPLPRLAYLIGRTLMTIHPLPWHITCNISAGVFVSCAIRDHIDALVAIVPDPQTADYILSSCNPPSYSLSTKSQSKTAFVMPPTQTLKRTYNDW